MDRTEKGQNFAGPGSCLACGSSDNPPGNRFCGRCGASLERSPARGRELAPKNESKATLRERLLPGRLGPVGKTVVAGLAVAAVDISLSWLHHRLEATQRPALPHNASHVPREESTESVWEYLYTCSLKEAAVLVEEGQEARRSYSSELTIRSSRTQE